MNTEQCIYIDTRNNNDLFETIITLADHLGIGVSSGRNRGSMAWQINRIDLSAYTYNVDQGNKEVSPSEFIAFLCQHSTKNNTVVKPYEKLVSLNEEYRANVTKANVKVGCQTFSHSVIADLYNASVEAQKAQA